MQGRFGVKVQAMVRKWELWSESDGGGEKSAFEQVALVARPQSSRDKEEMEVCGGAMCGLGQENASYVRTWEAGLSTAEVRCIGERPDAEVLNSVMHGENWRNSAEFRPVRGEDEKGKAQAGA